jgi:hypothetical protein
LWPKASRVGAAAFAVLFTAEAVVAEAVIAITFTQGFDLELAGN